jgi:formiminoglutamase
MTLPLLISVPHAGISIPERLRDKCLLSQEQIIKDGDEFASTIYAPLEEQVAAYVSTDIGRAIIDINRAEGDIRKDGIVKTHTCWEEPVWKEPLSEEEVEWLLDTWHRPYHQKLSEHAKRSDLVLAIDCHTMAAYGPPVGPDPGVERPNICLGNVNGQSCPGEWFRIIQSAFQKYFPGEVTTNTPFAGGYITQSHCSEMPWIQLELSRGDYASPEDKSRWVASSLQNAIEEIIEKSSK